VSARRCDLVRISASASFTRTEVELLEQLVGALLRGGDARGLVRRPETAAIARKVRAMRAAIDRQKARRAELEHELGQPDPNRSDR
jgi:hypothetical protein